MRMSWTIGRRALVAALAVAAAGCGDNQEPVESPLVIAKTATKSGDNQTGLPGAALDASLRVIVTREGVAEAGVSVSWSTSDGGSFPSPNSLTDANGVATSAWTLGAALGTQTARASVSGAENSPLTFTATADTDQGGGGGGPPPTPAGAPPQRRANST